MQHFFQISAVGEISPINKLEPAADVVICSCSSPPFPNTLRATSTNLLANSSHNGGCRGPRSTSWVLPALPELLVLVEHLELVFHGGSCETCGCTNAAQPLGPGAAGLEGNPHLRTAHIDSCKKHVRI